MLHFVPRFVRERDGGSEPGLHSCLSLHLAEAGHLPRHTEGELFSCFSTLLLFCSFSFFYFGARLAGLSMAHICCSSPLVFTTTLGLTPPRRVDTEEQRGCWRGESQGCSWKFKNKKKIIIKRNMKCKLEKYFFCK